MRRILIVGESSGGVRPFLPESCSGRMLAWLLGVDDAAKVADLANIAQGLPPLGGYIAVVALGRYAERKLREAGADPVYVPHPSGRTRWWNDPAHTDAARKFFSDLIGQA